MESFSNILQLLVCDVRLLYLLDFFGQLALEVMKCNRVQGPEVNDGYAACD
jgi:hypothetical protein